MVIKKEKDEDYHLVIADAANPRLTMIVEAPGSVFAGKISAVRQALDQRFGEIARLQPNVAVSVTGVAFFDVLHGQEGVAKSGIELHRCLRSASSSTPANNIVRNRNAKIKTSGWIEFDPGPPKTGWFAPSAPKGCARSVLIAEKSCRLATEDAVAHSNLQDEGLNILSVQVSSPIREGEGSS
jgi:hypothetical protein